MERYQKLLILRLTAPTPTYHTTQNRADLAKHQAEPKPKPPTGKLDANEEQAYEAIKKMAPAQAEEYRKQVIQADSETYARTAGSGQRARRLDRHGDDSSRRRATPEWACTQMQAKLDAMSPADRQKPVAVVIHHGDWEFNTDELISMQRSRRIAAGRAESARSSIRRARCRRRSSSRYACPGYQGLENKDYERYVAALSAKKRARSRSDARATQLLDLATISTGRRSKRWSSREGAHRRRAARAQHGSRVGRHAPAAEPRRCPRACRSRACPISPARLRTCRRSGRR